MHLRGFGLLQFSDLAALHHVQSSTKKSNSSATSSVQQHKEQQHQQPHNFSLWRLSCQDECTEVLTQQNHMVLHGIKHPLHSFPKAAAKH